MAFIIGDDFESETEVELIDSDQELRAFFARTPRSPDTLLEATWRTGTPIPPDVVPTKARIVEGEALRDWNRLNSGQPMVSARFKDCVEELEPGQHGFFPVTVEDKTGVVWPGPFFLFNVVGCIDSIIETQSNFNAVGRGQSKIWQFERATGPWKCALDAAVIGERACWTERRYSLRWFVSDRLAALLRQHRLTGFDLDFPCEEVLIG